MHLAKIGLNRDDERSEPAAGRRVATDCCLFVAVITCSSHGYEEFLH